MFHLMYGVFQGIIAQFMRRSPAILMKITNVGGIRETRREENALREENAFKIECHDRGPGRN